MIYVASSWRNPHQQEIVAALRAAGVEVYDFRNPPARTEFAWEQVDREWKEWDVDAFRRGLFHPVAESGFREDMHHLRACRAGILALPCGRSAHLEAGYVVGAGKPLAIFLPPGRTEPELMYKMAIFLTSGVPSLVQWAAAAEAGAYNREVDNGRCS